MDIVAARQALQKLVDEYNKKFKDDKSLLSNEKQICASLILPLVEAVLHWNTKDVSEFRLEEQRAGKRPDYLVYYQGMTQFIVEAKAATKDLFEDEAALTQALEYGYNADKEFVILTNFRQIVILAPKIQYRNVHEAAIARINLLTVSDDDLKTLLCFEREYWISAAKDNLLYSKLVHHKKSVPVDDRLLDDMKNWREMLLTNIQKKNLKLNFDDEQDFAEIEKEVQKIIDRLVFICCCEDKGIHHEPTLKRLLNEKQTRYSMTLGWLLESIHGLFAKYRKVPDSDLFDMSPADKYIIEDTKLMDLLTDLREPKGRPAYNFDEIDEDILGKVYENFIGHVQTGKKRFKEKEDIGKRKKEGIYYTPKYIVEYIVNNTVRDYIKGKSFEEILKVKILDPACGSGSFLLRAFNVLIEEAAKALKRPLEYAEKKDLLLNCIYGVDLDERAVEITKLTFSLKLAQISEGLPVLADNIRHGNSLIDDKEVAGDYLAFKWEDEFKEIMTGGGFNIVIGNPPYGVAFKLEEKKYFELHYSYVKSVYESYRLFLERVAALVKEESLVGLIIPNTWFYLTNAQHIRVELLSKFSILKLINLPQSVFEDATVDTCIIIFTKKIINNNQIGAYFFPHKDKINNLSNLNYVAVKQKDLLDSPGSVINLKLNVDDVQLIAKIKKQPVVLNDYVEIITGIKPYQVGKGNPSQTKRIVDEKPFTALTKLDQTFKPWLTGKFIYRYGVSKNKEYISYGKWLAEPKTPNIFERDRIVLQQIRNPSLPRRIVATFILGGIFTNNGIHNLLPKDKVKTFWILGILNSKLMNFYFSAHYNDVNIKPSNLYNLPYPIYSSESKISELVGRILELNEKLKNIKEKNTDESNKIQNEIQKIDGMIDNEVFKLFNLSDTEINIVQQNNV